MSPIPDDEAVTPFRVGCRVNGTIQQYTVEAADYIKAQQIVAETESKANPILVLIQ